MRTPFNHLLRYGLLIFALSCLSRAAAPALSSKSKTFITKVAHRGVEEMAMGKLIETHGQSAEVKKFGRQVLSDRTTFNDELRALGARKGVAVPTENTNVAIGHNPALGALAWGAGYAGPGGLISNYDKRWSAQMEKFLRDDLAECQEEAKSSTDPDLKAWAAQTFQNVKQHLLALMEIRSKLK